MTFSPLTARTIKVVAPTGYSDRSSSRQGAGVKRLIIHYTAGGSDTGNEREMANNINRVASSTYVLRRDGSLSGIIPEERRPWTSGGQAADGPSVTVETVAPPTGDVTAAQILTLKKLAADLSKRYGWGPLTRSNVRGHREFQDTNCPGAVLWPMMDQIVADANKIRGGATVPVTPAPAPSGGKTIAQLAQEVIDGKYGNGEARKAALGSNYAAVQAEVNRRLAGGVTATAPAKPSVNIDKLAQEVIAGKYGNGDARRKALGNNYAAVQARVNQMLGVKAQPVTTKPASPSVNIDALARAVIRGDYGNGEARKKALGGNYSAVQKRVNQILGYK